jgi:hypothetical protein
VYDGDGNALGDTSFKEVFGDLTYLVPRCEGDSSFAQVPSLEGDSFLTESLLDSDVTNQEYLLGDAVSDAVGDPTLGEPTIDHPQDLNKDGKIIACLDRQDSDCEYPGIGTLTLRLPLKGSIAISNANFDVNKIGQYQRGMESGSQIFVTLSPPTQGGCTLPQNAAAFSMKDFWNAVTYSNTQISWDLFTGDNWAIFSSGCRLVHDRVDLTMRLHLPFVTTSYSGFEDIEISSATAEAAPNYQLPYPVQITNSCLAEGTRISTAHGADLRIEDIRVGDVVANPFAASLTVADMSIGVERAPMVHVTDSRGHELLMTEKHPLYVSGRGMVPAVRLARGDEIKTVDGPARLVTISREAYSGKVYNLKLGNASETLALGADQTTMYANGILVGDSQIQTEHEFMELRAQVRRDALPARWRDDYSSSRDRFRALQPQP